MSVHSADARRERRAKNSLLSHSTVRLDVNVHPRVELAPAFGGDLDQQNRFLDQAGIDFHHSWTLADTEAVHHAWHPHVAARRSGTLAKRLIGDILIGDLDSDRRGLITRDPGGFHNDFPNLQILVP